MACRIELDVEPDPALGSPAPGARTHQHGAELRSLRLGEHPQREVVADTEELGYQPFPRS